MTDLYFQVGTALALVVGLIVLLGLFLRKRQEKDGLMKVLGYQSLGPKKGIAAVRIGQEVLLVGVTASDLKLLKSFDDPLDGPEAAKAPQPKPTVGEIADKLGKLKAMKDALYAVK